MAIDVADHVEALEAMRRVLEPFPPEQRIVIVASALGTVASQVGPEPSATSARMWIGMSLEMAFDMVRRLFDEDDDGPDELLLRGHLWK